MRFMLDTDIFDHIVADEIFLKKVRQAAQARLITLLVTHIQEDQLAEAPPEKGLSRVPREVVPFTQGMVLGASRLGMAQLGDDETNQAIERIGVASDSERATLRNRKDALIATTAREADVLVTDDKKLRNRINRLGFSLTVWSFARFGAFVDTFA
jgi:predicted nucleic acid-binding protein